MKSKVANRSDSTKRKLKHLLLIWDKPKSTWKQGKTRCNRCQQWGKDQTLMLVKCLIYSPNLKILLWITIVMMIRKRRFWHIRKQVTFQTIFLQHLTKQKIHISTHICGSKENIWMFAECTKHFKVVRQYKMLWSKLKLSAKNIKKSSRN